jgi:hypothetical protein
MRSRVLGRKGVAGTGHHHYTTGDPSPLSVLSPPHSQPRALRHTTVLSNIMSL